MAPWIITMSNKKFRKAAEEIIAQYEDRGEKIRELQLENERLKSERYKDEELTKMKQQYDWMERALRRGFPISDEENKCLVKWIEDHIEKAPEKEQKRKAPKHRIVSYSFEPTELGMFKSVTCSCGEHYCYNQRFI